MIYPSLTAFLKAEKGAIGKGPIALILLEDDVEVDSTLRHHLESGFRRVIAFGLANIDVAPDVAPLITRVYTDVLDDGALENIVNGVIEIAEGQWLFYCYNSEYLFFPFCETRTVGEMIGFSMEERRHTILNFIIDIYAGDLHAHPTAVSMDDAYLDRSGYYALARQDAWNNDIDRQFNFFGGLRWRFEEHVPVPRRRIDRTSLFLAKNGLRIRADHTANDPEYNTYACPWHNSLTASVVSFRTAKALARNPGSAPHIKTFRWHNSAPFEWHSQQLLALGLMEPGQWF
ncbi:hypothetical protein [Loktanella sp. SALINAS62]|uniref:hypothetical protein n=1 Tax=Loktanella sp. SALINAS62 TaxID=2706124 RepID=UPI001B8AEE3B|nr:hypothetical protein [Loktanella sp. SALINAS62]MBS1303217.1 hypothetical protein [Loktanella sp. SALINAS62]